MSNLERLWQIFKSAYGETGAAALLGNIRAESAYNPQNLQNSYEKKLGFTDATYTAAVDSGAYPREKFEKDSAGYGLCQWTHWSRKRNLYNYVKNLAGSIGDLDCQANFCIFEIGAYGLTSLLSGSASLREKTAAILRQYEKPADQSEANVDRRTRYAEEILAQFKTVPVSSPKYAAIAEELRAEADRLRALADKIETEV